MPRELPNGNLTPTLTLTLWECNQFMLLAFQIDIDTVAYVFSLSAREAGLILGQVIGRGVVVIRPCQKKTGFSKVCAMKMLTYVKKRR